jgi:hypothetical protein
LVLGEFEDVLTPEFSYPRRPAGFDGTPAPGVVFSPGGALGSPLIDR